MRSWRARLSIAGLVAGLLGPIAAVPAEAGKPVEEPPGKPVTVMTRNVYLGADINRPVDAALEAARAREGDTPQVVQQRVLLALARATHQTRAIVDATSFPVRAGLLADEIVDAQPDLVGLQEVALWRSGPLQLDRIGQPNAEQVDLDYLALLLAALADRGVAYTAVEVGDRADVEAPSFAVHPADGTARDVRMTMRDVILMRTDTGLRVTGSGDRVFQHNLEVPVAGVVMEFDRGFHWVDVRVGARDLRFVNSHFEAFSSDLAWAQAAEVVATAPTDRTTVFVCDCNSDPVNGSVKPHDTRPHHAAYDLITGPGGFTDQWATWGVHDLPGFDPGDTSGLNERVDEPAPPSFTHRIDMVFARTAAGEGLVVDRGEVTGNESAAKDLATGLWPSDHAGVVLRLRELPR